MKKRKITALVMTLLLGVVAFSGCGKKETESKYKIYYVNEEQGEVLAESFVPSEETTQTMLEEMTEKLNKKNAEGHTLLPENIEIQSCVNDDGMIRVDFNQEYHDLNPVDEVLLRASIVKDYVQIPDIYLVTITAGGTPIVDSQGQEIGAMSLDSFLENTGKEIIEDLQNGGYIVKIEELEHEVQTHERCGKEVEYSVMKQWFIDIMNHKEDFLRIGNEIKWHPSHMHNRYNEWVENIMWDWCISRQRYFGEPFPVWYCKDCGEAIFAREEDLPVNPLSQQPHCDKCPKCGCTEFIPETDVMDTWATSSVTPLINMKFGEKENNESFLKPMSIRTNASEIIRTWDFYTIVKSFYHFGIRPWDNVMISGFVMASKGEKISKSKGNSKVEPLDLIKQYSADVIRYWAGSGRLGTDMLFSEETLLRGRKLVNKLWNVSKFIEMHLSDYEDKEFNDFEYIDKWILGKYQEMESGFLKYLDEYEVGLALNHLEKFFWNFCDNYIEIVKHRLYRPEEFGEQARYSGQKTVYMILYKLLQDFSIFFPFITEEIFQELYHNKVSIHLTEIKQFEFNYSDEIKNGDIIIDIISQARGEKTNNNVSLKTPIRNLDLSLNQELEDAINASIKDFKATLFIENLNIKAIDKDYNVDNIELNLEEVE